MSKLLKDMQSIYNQVEKTPYYPHKNLLLNDMQSVYQRVQRLEEALKGLIATVGPMGDKWAATYIAKQALSNEEGNK